MAKILVTGGAGFIGSHVAIHYLNQGHQVIIVDNLSTGKKENIPAQAKFYQADICDRNAMEKIFESERPDIVNHHAAQIDVRESVSNPQKDAEVNIIGGINLIELSKKFGTSKWIYASTGGALYGEAPEKPSAENAPINTVSHYGVSKYCLEHYIQLYARLYNLNYTILRYSNVYGPRQNPLGEAGVIAIFINAMLKGQNPNIYGDGEQIRDYVYVGDVAQANLKALKVGDQKTINIGSDQGTTVNQLFGFLKELMGFQGEAQHKLKRIGEIYKSRLDVRFAEEVLDWKAQVRLEEGLKNTIAWQRGAC